MPRLIFPLVLVLCLGCRAAAAVTWQAQLDRGHPLVGRIWDVAGAVFVTADVATSAAARSTFVLLGERHDNPDHHRLQADIVAALAAAGRRPAVVFEMIDEARQPALDAYLAGSPGDAAGLGAAVGWAGSGWPDWSLYRPIAEAALAAGLALRAGNLPPGLTRAISRHGLAVLPADRRRILRLDQPLPAAMDAALRRDLFDAHCGALPMSAMDRLVAVQRARDAVMAGHMAAALADGQDGAVLIAGAGHTRLDRGVPATLRRLTPAEPVLAIAFMEVVTAATAPPDYADDDGVLPFDYVWFTPRLSDADPCAGLRDRAGQSSRPAGPEAD